MRVLIVGYGRMGQRRVRACRNLGHEVHVVEPDAAHRVVCGCPSYARIEDAPLCDAAFVCTPADTHAQVVGLWPARDVGVLGKVERLAIEKPLDVIAERGGRLASSAACARACVAYSWRFHPVVRDFCAAIAASGDLRVLRFTCFAPKRFWSSPPKPGQMWPECSHEVDLSL